MSDLPSCPDYRELSDEGLEKAKEEIDHSLTLELAATLLEGADTDAARVLRPPLAHAIRQAPGLAVENIDTTEADNASIFAQLFKDAVLYVPGLGWRVYDTEKGSGPTTSTACI